MQQIFSKTQLKRVRHKLSHLSVLSTIYNLKFTEKTAKSPNIYYNFVIMKKIPEIAHFQKIYQTTRPRAILPDLV